MSTSDCSFDLQAILWACQRGSRFTARVQPCATRLQAISEAGFRILEARALAALTDGPDALRGDVVVVDCPAG
jgi:hypothetical protein